MKRKSIVFIIPYFGEFNNYFQLFLNSCRFNSDINWLIYTDCKKKYDYPKNVQVKYTTFKEIQERFQNKFDFKISLNKPYKLCDFKVTYGYVFQEDIKDYDFWGHCDIDMIFGDIRKFYTDELLEKFEKIGFFGHCSIFKNTSEINELFKSRINGEEIYKKVYSSDEGYAFDEEFHDSINDIFVNQQRKVCFEEFQANIYTKSSNFRLTKYNFETKKYEIEKKQKAFFIFDRGKILRVYKNGDIKEFLYIHMQARKMKVNNNDSDYYKIIPNSFDDIEFDINALENISKVRNKHFNLHYFIHRSKNLIKKIKKRMR